jgi:hypothetical protein
LAADAATGTIQNCTASDVTIDVASGTRVYGGGLAGQTRGVDILQCAVTNVDASVDVSGTYIQFGGLVGVFDANATESVLLQDSVVDGLTIAARATGAKMAYQIGGLAGVGGIRGADTSMENCAVTGDVAFDIATSNGVQTNECQLGGFVGLLQSASVENSSLGDFKITSDDVAGTNSKTNWSMMGILAGYVRADQTNGTSAYPVVISGDMYEESLATLLLSEDQSTPRYLGYTRGVGYMSGPVTPADWYLDIDSLSTFDEDDLANSGTLFASFFKGGTIQLAIGETLDLNLQAFAGWAGITGTISWASDKPEFATVAPDDMGRNATITAVAPGTATIMCMFNLNSNPTVLPLKVEVTDVPPYATGSSFPDSPTPVTPTGGHHSSSNCNAFGIGLLALLGLGYVVKKK